MTTVFLTEYHWDRKGHGGVAQEVDYEIFLGSMRLRGFSTHGNMHEGYWGFKAKTKAEEYAAEVAQQVGVKVLRAKLKERKA